MQLTLAQIKLLELLAGGPTYVAGSYPPFRKLKELGLADDKEVHFGRVAFITEAGRAAMTRGE